jgi:sugar phosphate isomerase/epimerase
MDWTRRGFLRLAGGALAGAAVVGRALAVPRLWPSDEPARIRVGSCAYSLRDLLTAKPPTMDLFGFLDYCKSIELDGVELTQYYFPAQVDADYLKRLVDRCAELGLTVSGGAVGGALTGPVAEKADTLAMIRTWLGYYQTLGAPLMRIFAGEAPKETSVSQAREWVVACISECLPAAEEAGVRLALENHGGVVADPEGVLEILGAVDSPWLAANLDTGNFHGEDPYADLARVAPYAANVHAKISVSAAGKPAEPADWDRLGRMLLDVGYRGFVSIEYEGAQPPLEGVRAEADRISAALARLAEPGA